MVPTPVLHAAPRSGAACRCWTSSPGALQPACTVLASPCRSGDEWSARRSARSEDVVAQEHPQQNQHSDRNAHQVQDEVADPAALVVVPIHVSSLPRCRRAATRREGEEHAACQESAPRTRPKRGPGCGSSVHRSVACRYFSEAGCSTVTKQGTPPGTRAQADVATVTPAK